MTNYTVVRLENFKGGLHLARGLTNSYDKSLQTLHSDTLKSALFVCALQLYGEEVIEKSFLENFKISSAFPFYKHKEEFLYFFPKPEIPKLPFRVSGEFGIEKKLKKVRFLEKKLFEKFIEDSNKIIDFDKDDLVGNFIGEKSSGLKNILPKGIMKSEPCQHVHIPKDYNEYSEPYYVDNIYFEKDAGLFCLIDCDNIELLNKIKAAFKLLADNGIGTNRNTGNGQFDIAFDKMKKITTPSDTNYQLSLSLYCPKKDENINEIETINKSFYGLTKRGGYISSPKDEKHLTLRKRSIYMFTEGSVFYGNANRQGKIVNLQPNNNYLKNNEINHPIWRDGQALFIPFNYQNQ